MRICQMSNDYAIFCIYLRGLYSKLSSVFEFLYLTRREIDPHCIRSSRQFSEIWQLIEFVLRDRIIPNEQIVSLYPVPLCICNIVETLSVAILNIYRTHVIFKYILANMLSVNNR